MQTENLALMIPIILSLGAFLMIFGIRNLMNKENMAMIERGMDPQKVRRQRDDSPSKTLKDSLLFIGAGIGLLLSVLITNIFNLEGNTSTAVYFGFIAIFGGAGMLSAYLYERNYGRKDSENNF
jgi:hypothetical protein